MVNFTLSYLTTKMIQVFAGYVALKDISLDSISFFLNGAKIDPNVTMDIHRIFRLPGSINSKSGLTKILCENLQTFDPYIEASFIGDDSVEVLANCPIEFKLKNKKFGPYLNEKVTIPRFAAVYLICKKLASLS